MTSIDKQIVDSQLKEMGLAEEKKQPRREFATEMRDPQRLRDRARRTRREDAASHVVETGRSNKWHRDPVCERLAEMAGKWKEVNGAARMSERDFEQVVATLATDFANAMEHAGLIYRTRIAPAILADMVSDFITTQTLVRIGDRYLDVEME